MQVNFASARMARACSSQGQRTQKYGPERAKKLGLRLDQMRAAEQLSDLALVPGARFHQLKSDRDETFSVDLDGPYRLLFEVDMNPTPRCPDGGIDLEAVDAVLVTEIADTH